MAHQNLLIVSKNQITIYVESKLLPVAEVCLFALARESVPDYNAQQVRCDETRMEEVPVVCKPHYRGKYPNISACFDCVFEKYRLRRQDIVGLDGTANNPASFGVRSLLLEPFRACS
jgi:hypothetical protein